MRAMEAPMKSMKRKPADMLRCLKTWCGTVACSGCFLRT